MLNRKIGILPLFYLNKYIRKTMETPDARGKMLKFPDWVCTIGNREENQESFI